MLIGAKSCRNCEFKIAKGTQLHCRRYPPQTFVLPSIGPQGPTWAPMTWYPPVNPDEPCGEHKRNEFAAMEELSQAGATAQ